ncbi:SPJ_0845 family protein [uncultured Streptococcus sp.]|nr:SPJ_0845 family protein [uncultured Streptococcus sp.]
MAITHKRQDDLESMFASFANIPKISSDPEKEKKVKDKKAEKATD